MQLRHDSARRVTLPCWSLQQHYLLLSTSQQQGAFRPVPVWSALFSHLVESALPNIELASQLPLITRSSAPLPFYAATAEQTLGDGHQDISVQMQEANRCGVHAMPALV
jgi:hypothetical protein